MPKLEDIQTELDRSIEQAVAEYVSKGKIEGLVDLIDEEILNAIQALFSEK